MSARNLDVNPSPFGKSRPHVGHATALRRSRSKKSGGSVRPMSARDPSREVVDVNSDSRPHVGHAAGRVASRLRALQFLPAIPRELVNVSSESDVATLKKTAAQSDFAPRPIAHASLYRRPRRKTKTGSAELPTPSVKAFNLLFPLDEILSALSSHSATRAHFKRCNAGHPLRPAI